MRKIFPYLRKGNQFFPIIKVKLKGPKEELMTEALVDSGASFSVFRSEVADYLGIPTERGKLVYLTGIGGRILGYLHNLKISLGKKNFNCKIVFSKEYTVSLNILGRDNFFQPFLISFWEKAKKVILILKGVKK